MIRVITKLLMISLSLNFVQSLSAQINSQAEISQQENDSSSSGISMSFGMDYVSNLYEKQSSESKSNLTGYTSLVAPIAGKRAEVSLSYTKQLQDYKEGELNDATLSFSGFDTQLNENFSLTGAIVGVLALNETSKKVSSFQGALSVPVSFVHRPESIDWLTNYIYVRATQNSHEFAQDFNGESNPSFSTMVGVGMNISFSDSLNWIMKYKVSQARSYSGEKFDPVSGYETFLNYQLNKNTSLSLGLITQVTLYNDQSKLQSTQRLFASGDSLFTSGIAITF